MFIVQFQCTTGIKWHNDLLPHHLCMRIERQRIHSDKRPGHLDNSFWVSGYLFHYLVQRLTQKWMILAGFSLIPSHIELSMKALWKELGGMVDYFMVYNFIIWWVGLIRAWAAIRANTVFSSCLQLGELSFSELSNLNCDVIWENPPHVLLSILQKS